MFILPLKSRRGGTEIDGDGRVSIGMCFRKNNLGESRGSFGESE